MFLNRSYWPDAEASGQLLTELCEDLARQFDVTVVAGQPNHNPRNEKFSRNSTEKHNGVTVERVWHPQGSKRSLVARAIGLVGFLLAATFRVFRIKRPDVVVVETDPFILASLGSWLKTWYRCHLIIYLQDLYPDIAVILGKVHEGWLTRFLRRRLTAAYRHADAIVVLSDDMKNRLMTWGIDGSRIVCIENWVDTAAVYPAKFDNPMRVRESIEEKFVVMHSGNMGLSQFLDNVLDAAALIDSRWNLEFLLVGDGASRRELVAQAKRLDLKNVRFLPYQPREELAQSLSAADLHLISMHPEAHHCLMPSKLYGILSSGTPVLAITAQDSELARLIREYNIGFAIAPGNPKLLAESLGWCATHRDELQEMGRRSRIVAVEQFDRKRQTARFGELLSRLCGVQTKPALFETAIDQTSTAPQH